VTPESCNDYIPEKDFRFGQPGMRCSDCSDWWPFIFFRRNRRAKCTWHTGQCVHPTCHHPACIGCELSARTERKAQDRWYDKAYRALQRHWKDEGFTSQRDFEHARDLTVREVADVMQDAWERNLPCTHCGTPWQDMTHGSDDMTFHKVDPEQPLTRNGWMLMCMTGNRDWGQTPRHVWDMKQACWKHYIPRRAERHDRRLPESRQPSFFDDGDVA
jgi:hypothetical protein